MASSSRVETPVFIEDVEQMPFDSFLGNRKLGGDIFIAATFNNALDRLYFAWRQAVSLWSWQRCLLLHKLDGVR